MENDVVRVVVAPLVVALVSWLIKDYLFAQQKAKQELQRTEWQKRLTTFWSPLFLWSGMILFPRDEGGGNIENAVSELTTILAGNAHLLPREHYHVIISLIEKATVLPDKEIDLENVRKTRAYVYRQIEILNYLLYKRGGSLDPLANIIFFEAPLALLRMTASAVMHLIVWGLLAAYVYLGYFLFEEGRVFWLVMYSFVLMLPLWVDAERRIEMRREAVDHRIVRNRFGLLALLRRLKKRWL